MKINENTKTVYFWSYKDVFSNHFMSPIVAYNNTFNCGEQLFMFKKALLFNDKEMAQKIVKTCKPNDQKKLGRMVKNFDQEIWDKNKERLMKETVEVKFNQPYMEKILNRHENYKFVEASPYDKIWGVGLKENDPDILDESKWKGENLLGKVLTEVFSKQK